MIDGHTAILIIFTDLYVRKRQWKRRSFPSSLMLVELAYQQRPSKIQIWFKTEIKACTVSKDDGFISSDRKGISIEPVLIDCDLYLES